MKICFITPPSAFLLDERVFVNLGILKIAACCIERGHQVEHLDLDGVENFEYVAETHAAQSNADWYALTATTPQMPATARIAKAIKARRPNAKLMIGGPHPTLTAAAAKVAAKSGLQLESTRATKAMAQLRELFDVVVAGDGEDAIEQALRIGRGLVDADDPSGTLFLSKKRLNELPMPARELVDLSSYHYKIDGIPATSLVCQLGCPFNCSFCGGRASPMLRRARMRSTESVIAEMEHLYVNHGYRAYMIYDDEMNVNPKMVELMRAIVALQKKHGVEFRLRGFVKAELFTQEQADVMYEAGFRWLLTGFEAAHPRILENIQKKATVEDNTRCVETAKRAGLKVKALMSIGHAGESEETVHAVRDWLLEMKPDDFDCTIITPYPGSPYYDEAVQTWPPSLGTTWQRWCRKEYDRIDCDGPIRDGLGNLITNDDPVPTWWCKRRAGHDGRCKRYTPLDELPGPVWTYTAPRSGDRLHAFEIDYFAEADYYKGKPGGGYVSHVFTDYLSPEDLVRLRDELEADVRAKLNIPFNPGQAPIRYEHSMGMPGPLPDNILRSA